MPEAPIKRVRYFTGQFLEAVDFQAEQGYHVDQAQRGRRAMYGPGIVDGGLQVNQSGSDPTRIVISPGMAFDAQGHEIVVASDLAVSLPAPSATVQAYLVSLRYGEQETDQQTPDSDVSDNTRIEERPTVEFTVQESAIDKARSIIVARVTVGTDGRLSGAVDASVRRYAAAHVPGPFGVGTAELTNVLHVNGQEGIRQNSLYLSGSAGASSLSYNAHRSSQPTGWTFPDTNRPAVTLEMDDNSGKARFEVWSTTTSAKTSWVNRLRIDGETGNVQIASNVGIGPSSPDGYSLMISGGDTRIAAANQEQSLFGLDRLVGLNDLRFYVDDLGASEVMHLDSTGLRFSMGNPPASQGFHNTLTPKNIAKAWGVVRTGTTSQLLEGFNVDLVTTNAASVSIRLKEGISSPCCMVGSMNDMQINFLGTLGEQQLGAVLSFRLVGADAPLLPHSMAGDIVVTGLEFYIPSGDTKINMRTCDFTREYLFCFVVFGNQT